MSSKTNGKDCPLCMDALEIDDLSFYPCTCSYQVCRFCWNRIITSENGLCPACRRPYNSEEPASFKPITQDEFKQINRCRKPKARICPMEDNKKELADKRVLQENLLFVVNLPTQITRDEEVLSSELFFGKYGPVHKVVINQTTSSTHPDHSAIGNGQTCSQSVYTSAYVTYKDKNSAMLALLDINGQGLNGMRSLKVSFGTTKYCSQYLKGQSCTKKECMYLHVKGEDKASFTKEQMALGLHTQYEADLIKQFKINLDPSQIPEGHILAPRPAPTPLLNCDEWRDFGSANTVLPLLSLNSGSVDGTDPSENLVNISHHSYRSTISSSASSGCNLPNSSSNNFHVAVDLIGPLASSDTVNDNSLCGHNNASSLIGNQSNLQHHQISSQMSYNHQNNNVAANIGMISSNNSIAVSSSPTSSALINENNISSSSAQHLYSPPIMCYENSNSNCLNSSLISNKCVFQSPQIQSQSILPSTLSSSDLINSNINNNNKAHNYLTKIHASGNSDLLTPSDRKISDEDSSWLLDLVSNNLSHLKALVQEEQQQHSTLSNYSGYSKTLNSTASSDRHQYYTHSQMTLHHSMQSGPPPPPPGFETDNYIFTRQRLGHSSHSYELDHNMVNGISSQSNQTNAFEVTNLLRNIMPEDATLSVDESAAGSYLYPGPSSAAPLNGSYQHMLYGNSILNNSMPIEDQCISRPGLSNNINDSWTSSSQIYGNSISRSMVSRHLSHPGYSENAPVNQYWTNPMRYQIDTISQNGCLNSGISQSNLIHANSHKFMSTSNKSVPGHSNSNNSTIVANNCLDY